MDLIKKILFIVYITLVHAQNIEGNLALIGQFPQKEFKDAGVTTGLGGDLNLLYYSVDQLGFGINLGGSVYDISTRQIPFVMIR